MQKQEIMIYIMTREKNQKNNRVSDIIYQKSFDVFQSL